MSGTSVEGDDVFRVIQLAGPTAREAEEQVAKYIEEQVALYDQRDLGARTRRGSARPVAHVGMRIGTPAVLRPAGSAEGPRAVGGAVS
jgi:hypothetical protein